MRVVYKRLRAVVEGFNGRAKSRLAYRRLTWQGLENANIHVGLVLMVAYAVCIAAYGIGRPELRHGVAFFACGWRWSGTGWLEDALLQLGRGGSFR